VTSITLTLPANAIAYIKSRCRSLLLEMLSLHVNPRRTDQPISGHYRFGKIAFQRQDNILQAR